MQKTSEKPVCCLLARIMMGFVLDNSPFDPLPSLCWKRFPDSGWNSSCPECTLANWALDNFHVLVTPPLDQKQGIFSHPISKCPASSGIYTYFLVSSYPKQDWLCGSSWSYVFNFFILDIYSLSYKFPAFLSHVAIFWMESASWSVK